MMDQYEASLSPAGGFESRAINLYFLLKYFYAFKQAGDKANGLEEVSLDLKKAMLG